MQTGAILSLLAILGSLTAVVEGANYVSGGEYFVASLQRIAQAEAQQAPPPPPPSGGEVFGPPPSGGSFGQPPPQSGGSFGTPSGGGFQPPSGPGGPVFGPPPGGQQQEQFGPPPQSQFGSPNQQQFGGQGQQGQTPFGGQGGPQQFPGQGQGVQSGFPGQGNPFGGQQGQSGDHGNQQFGGQQQEFQFEGDFGEEQDSGVFVSAQEIAQAKRELNDIKKQLNQLNKTRGITSDLKSKVQEMIAEVNNFVSVIGNSSASDEELRDAIDEFHQRNFWDDMNALRARIQLPNELKQLTKTITRLEKTFKTKTAAAVFDVNGLGQAVSEWKQQLSQVQAALSSGQYEEAQELMQVFYDNHPGECEGVVYQTLDQVKNIKRIKDQSLRSQADQLLQPIIALINQRECRDAREEFEGGVRSQINQYLKSTQSRSRTRQ